LVLQILELIEKKLDEIQKKEYLLIGIIMIVGLIFRIIITPWNLPSVASDVVIFFIEAFNFSNNNYEFFNPRFLWPFLLSIFFRIFEFNSYIEYVNLIRIVSIGLSLITIPVVYLIGKKFFEKKYSFLVASFFAFSIQIIENSTWGITEPLFLLLALGSFYFMLNYNSKYTIFSFILASLSFDTRVNGIVILMIILIGYSMKVRPKRKLFILIVSGLFIFMIISMPNYYDPEVGNSPIINRVTSISTDENNLNPHLIQTAKLFLTNEQLDPDSENFHKITILEKYLFGITKEAYHIFLINIQFLIFLLPIGIFFIFKNREWKEYLLILSIMISIAIAIPQYILSSEIRNLLLIIPFISIIATIGIKNLLKNIKKKNLIITLIILSLIISSIIILNPQTDNTLIIEKEKFGKYVSLNYSGKITGDLLYHVENHLFDLTSIPLKYNQGNGIITDYSFFSILSENQFIKYLKNNEISYVIIDNKIDNRYQIFEDIFQNEKKYPYLSKIFDSNQEYDFLKVKIFKVNFE
jgi:4-amino-4-deoxy-L-arabinose transferase-like glycosyltransferase